MRVLIAEDDAVSRRVLEANLKKWGYEVVIACDGLEALGKLSGPEAPRLAILDWMMPGKDGIEVCREIRRAGEEPYVYILLLTAKGRREDIIEGMHSGADDYITKPFDAHELKLRLGAGRRIIELQEELIHAREILRYQATHDILTGLWNRAAILDMLNRELARSGREGTPCALAMADFDHFKDVNDTYGHEAGDRVLKEAGRRMAAAVRGYDAVGRYGGEEFLIILPGCREIGAVKLAERLRVAIGNEPIDLQGLRVHITVSIGVAINTGTRYADVGAFIRTADTALYLAKNRGRNRVELATEFNIGDECPPAESA